MNTSIDTRRILVFLAFAFGISWLIGLVVFLTGGLIDSPALIPGTPVTLALVLVATLYMWSPALAHIFTRLLTREGWTGTTLRPHFRPNWPYWLAGWVLPAILTIFGGAVFYLFFPQHFDPTGSGFAATLAQFGVQAGDSLPLNAWVLAALQTAQAVLIGPIINSLFTFGEEFGWRGYLQPKLLPLGWRKAMLLMGLIWGAWHWPLTLMGHNYGLEYPGAPWLGPLVMVWFTFVLGVFLGWIALRGGSVWPAVIGHAAINGIAGIAVLFAQGSPNPILGPLPAGLVGSMGFSIVALWLFFRPGELPAVNSNVSRETSQRGEPA